MKIWFTSDYHLNHENIIKYCNRPFSTVEEMNETIISRHNERVKEDDWIFDLGDFNFKNSKGGKIGEGLPIKPQVYLNQLKGHRILIKGNHSVNEGIKTPIEKLYLKYGGKRICLVHDPKYADSYCELNIHGHVHTLYQIKRLNKNSLLINLSVEVWNYYPVTFEEIN